MHRYVIYGAGAIGGALGCYLAKAGASVTYIARGENYRVIKERGLRLRVGPEEELSRVDVVAHPSETQISEHDVVVLAMKTQDTDAAVRELAACACTGTPVVCAQNGVENERIVLRHFKNVYGAFVFIASAHLQPGDIDVYTAPCPGVVDIGRIPCGVDDLARLLAADLRFAGFDAVARPDIIAWKNEKLLLNLANAVQAISGATIPETVNTTALARCEGEQCLRAANLPLADRAKVAARIANVVNFGSIDGKPFPGGSSWQSLQRGKRGNEVAYLNGEIVLLGRLYGVPTPVNTFLHDTVRDMANREQKPGAMVVTELNKLVRSLAARTNSIATRSGD